LKVTNCFIFNAMCVPRLEKGKRKKEEPLEDKAIPGLSSKVTKEKKTAEMKKT
jgi:hypothetical protein